MLAVDAAVDGCADWPTLSSGGREPAGAARPVSRGDMGGRLAGGGGAWPGRTLAALTAARAISRTSVLFTDPLLLVRGNAHADALVRRYWRTAWPVQQTERRIARMGVRGTWCGREGGEGGAGALDAYGPRTQQEVVDHVRGAGALGIRQEVRCRRLGCVWEGRQAHDPL